jgi:anti-sigma regulatory factor (Ser/Thr protein kinase)
MTGRPSSRRVDASSPRRPHAAEARRGATVDAHEHRLPHSPSSATLARTLAEEELGPYLTSDRAEDLRLLVSELVTNAVKHAPPESDGTIVLLLERDGGVVRVVVRDGGTHVDPDLADFDSPSDGHYGLFFVDTRADRWGFSIDGDKGFWFEMDI